MAHKYTNEEVAAWLKSQPGKVVSSKVILRDGQGKMLVTRPNYKHGLHFVGGLVDKGESPLQAVLRETQEEVSITLRAEDLTFLGTRYGVSKRAGNDYIHFLYSAEITSGQIKQIKLQTEELDGMEWVDEKKPDDRILDMTYAFYLELLKRPSAAAYSDQYQVFVAST